MITRAPTLARILFPVSFVIVCLVVAIGLWRSFGGPVPMQAISYQVHVVVPSADAIFTNTDVRAAGVRIGRVATVRTSGRATDLTLAIDPDFAPIGRDARITVRSKSLLGEGYVELAPGRRDAPRMPDGGTLDASRVRPTQRLDDVLQTFSPRTRQRMRSMMAGIATAFDGRSEDLGKALGRARPLSRNVELLLDELRSQTGPMASLVADAEASFAVVGARSSQLREAVLQGSRVFRTTAARNDALRATVAALPPFLAQLRASADELGAMSGDLRRATRSLRPTVPLIVPALRSIDRGFPEFERTFRRVVPVLRSADEALPTLSRVLAAGGPALQPVHDALRELVPFMRLASLNRASIIANFANISALLGGVTVGSGGHLIHYGSAFLSVWNEIIGGYTKRLPTNTMNPYPKPGSVYDLQRNGVLSAYDCRNRDNPLIVPPTGTTPRCITQGRWTANGDTAYYPRLQRDAP
ncbi:MAG: MlaD family protein [Solirubrobacteraceae bacterium]